MTHINSIPETAGDFKDWVKCDDRPCHKCESKEVMYRIWESSCGSYEDEKYKCLKCGHTWWIEGSDS